MVEFGVLYEVQVNGPLKYPEREAQVFHECMEQIPFAEKMGFNYAWFVEHHYQPGYAHSSAPEVLLAALTQRTTTMRLGHGVVLLPYQYNHPARVAERIATLDILSHGRVEFGTGRSSTAQELLGYGITNRDETRATWEEALRLLATIWGGNGTFSFKGDYFDIPERTMVPMPVQKPHPPMWMACNSDASHEIAGRMGLGLLTLVLKMAPERVAERLKIYDEAAKNPDPIMPLINNKRACFYIAHCAETDQQARQNAEKSFVSYINTNDRSENAMDFDTTINSHMGICGGPDTCIRQVEEILKHVKVDQLMFMTQFWGIGHEATMKSIELLGKHVIPHFAKQGVKVTVGT